MPAKDREQRLRTQREYEAKRKAERQAIRLVTPAQTFNPAYDPRRDGPPVWRDATAYMLGDPPISRSALDQKQSGGRP